MSRGIYTDTSFGGYVGTGIIPDVTPTTSSNSFNFSDVMTTLSSVGGALTSGNSTDLNNSLANVAVETGLSFIPGGSAIASTLEGFIGIDIASEIGNVLNYGLNSWGASTTPEGIGVHLQNFEVYINDLLGEVSNGNVEAGINELSKFLWWGSQFYARMRNYHAQATSTKQAYDLAITFFAKYIEDVFKPLVKQLTDAGVLYNKTFTTVVANNYPHLGAPVDQNDPPIDYFHYSVNQSALSNLAETNLAAQNGNEENGNTETGNNSANPNVDEPKKSSGVTTGILGLLLYSMFK